MIDKLKQDLKNININCENLTVGDFTFDFYIKEFNYLIFIIDPEMYNEKTTNNKFLYDLRKKLDEMEIESLFIYKSEIVKNYEIYWNRLLYKFNINSVSVYARQCEVKEIDNDTYKKFLKEFHLQGYVSSKIKLGLFYNDILISIMSFGVPRFTKNYEYELSRYCSRTGYKIVGGASKLFTFFVKNYNFNNIICYSDMMIGYGNFYEKLGFKRLNDTGPGFQWYHPNTQQIYNRRGFWKNQLSKKLESFDPQISAHNNMRNNGYYKIFNLGNNVFVYEKL